MGFGWGGSGRSVGNFQVHVWTGAEVFVIGTPVRVKLSIEYRILTFFPSWLVAVQTDTNRSTEHFGHCVMETKGGFCYKRSC